MKYLKQLLKKAYWQEGNVSLKLFFVRQYMKHGFYRQHVFEDPKLHTDMYYFRAYKKHINWENPDKLDEKLGILKCKYGHNELSVQCADKYRVREYIEKRGLGYILNELYGVWDTWEDIDISSLPEKFALKRNNDAGGVLVVDNKAAADLKERVKKLGEGMNRECGLGAAELQYSRIEPCFIAEKYIGNNDGSFPYDYKFFCMNGKVRYILVCIGREKGKKMLRFIVDRDFILCPIMQGEQIVTNEEIQKYKPSILPEMLKIAETLSEPFPFVRVDLYDYNGKVLFGEMTFTPMGAVNGYINKEGQLLLGKYLDVSQKAFSREFINADIKERV